MSTNGFTLRDEPNQYIDILQDGMIISRYMYAYDNSTQERLQQTYKPYLHVFNTEGTTPITKGAGGHFTHHRGIFIGWNKIEYKAQSYDRWHMTDGEIIHRKFGEKTATQDFAILSSNTDWNDENQKPILREVRHMTFSQPSEDDFRLQIDFQSKLTAVAGNLVLNGDPEHAGVQYRPADELVLEDTTYTFPQVEADPRLDVDYPWVSETYTLNGKRHTIVQLNHLDNPKETKFSAYRDYGRFGAFFVSPIEDGATLTINYRFLIGEGELNSIAQVQANWDEFVGSSKLSDIPPITISGGGRKL